MLEGASSPHDPYRFAINRDGDSEIVRQHGRTFDDEAAAVSRGCGQTQASVGGGIDIACLETLASAGPERRGGYRANQIARREVWSFHMIQR